MTVVRINCGMARRWLTPNLGRTFGEFCTILAQRFEHPSPGYLWRLAESQSFGPCLRVESINLRVP